MRGPVAVAAMAVLLFMGGGHALKTSTKTADVTNPGASPQPAAPPAPKSSQPSAVAPVKR